MKTTLVIPDPILRRAKSTAAKRGIPLREFVAEALKDKLAAEANTSEKSKHMGKLKHLHKETERVNGVIEEAFEGVEPHAGRTQSMQALVGLWKNTKKRLDPQTHIRRLRRGKRLRRLAS
jgi:uncharacterized membrane protein